MLLTGKSRARKNDLRQLRREAQDEIKDFYFGEPKKKIWIIGLSKESLEQQELKKQIKWFAKNNKSEDFLHQRITSKLPHPKG